MRLALEYFYGYSMASFLDRGRAAMAKKKSAEDRRAASRRRTLEAWCREYPGEVIRALAETPHWPHELEEQTYARWADGKEGYLSVFVATNGDLSIGITMKNGEALFLRFECSFWGGQSLWTHAFIKDLAFVIDLENRKHPQVLQR